MPTTLIELEDGTLVEADITENEVEQISGSSVNKVNANLDKIKPIIVKSCDPIINSLEEVKHKNKLESVEVEIGLGFEGEGNLYITKAKAKANISLKLKFILNN